MSRTVTLAALIVTLVTFSAMTPFLHEESEGVIVQKFSDGSDTKARVFTGAGEDTTTFAFDIERDANVTMATFTVTGTDDGSGNYPRNVTINLNGAGDPEYKFKGTGYGDFGHQYMFNTSAETAYVRFTTPGDSDEAFILLPKTGHVTHAEVEVAGKGSAAGPKVLILTCAGSTSDRTNTLQQHLNTQSIGFDLYAPSAITSWTSDDIMDDYWSVWIGCQGDLTDSTMQTLLDGGIVEDYVRDGGIFVANAAHNTYLTFYGPGHSSFYRYSASTSESPTVTDTDHEWITGSGYGGSTLQASNFQGWGTTMHGPVDPPAGHQDSGGINLGTNPMSDAWNDILWSTSHSKSSLLEYTLDDGYCFINEMTFDWGTRGSSELMQMLKYMDFIKDNFGGGVGPANATLDVGRHGGSPDWSHPGELDQNEVITGFEDSINTYLSTHEPDQEDTFGNQLCKVPLNFTSDTKSRVRLLNLSITYDYTATVDKHPGAGNLTTEVVKILQNANPGSDNLTIPIHVSVDSAGRVELSSLNIGYDDAPVWSPVGPLFIPEDTHDGYLVDLACRCADDFDNSTELTYSVMSNSMSEHLSVYICDGHYLGVDATVDRNWNSESGDGGVAEVVLKVVDSGNHTALTKVIFIEVTPVNDEPAVQEPLPDMVIEEGAQNEAILLNARPYFFDVEYDMLHYDVMVDPYDVWEGEGGNLTASINPLAHTLEISASGDFNTEDMPPVPVWVFCDDDTQVNTIDDGALPNGRHNWTFQEFNVTVVNINDAPVWENLPNLELDEDETLTDAFDLDDHVWDIDSDPDEISFKLVKNSNKRIKVTIDDAGMVSVEPQPDQSGTATVEVEADDGDDDSATTFKITVNPINDPPVVDVKSHQTGQTVIGTVEMMGIATDIEGEVLFVEYIIAKSGVLPYQPPGTRAGDAASEPAWARAEGTDSWLLRWDTTAKGFPNGEYEVRIRAFDGTDLSKNVTLLLSVLNPINEVPIVEFSSPSDRDILWGELIVAGTAWDDEAVLAVEISVGDNYSWAPVSEGALLGHLTWSHIINVSHYEEGNLSIYVRSFDGEQYSQEASRTVVVEAPEVIGTGGTDASSVASRDDNGWLLWLLLVIIVAVTVILIMVMMMRSKTQREKEEEEERLRKEEEERAAASRTAAVLPSLSLARAGPGGAGGPGYGAAGPGAYAAPPPPIPAPPPMAELPPGGGYSPGGAPPPPVPPPLPPPPGGPGGALALPPAPPQAPSPPPVPPPPPGPTGSVPEPGTLPGDGTPSADDSFWDLSPTSGGAGAAGAAAGAGATAGAGAGAATDGGAGAGAGKAASVACFSCGAPIPVTLTGGPQHIRCPSCGTEGEIG